MNELFSSGVELGFALLSKPLICIIVITESCYKSKLAVLGISTRPIYTSIERVFVCFFGLNVKRQWME